MWGVNEDAYWEQYQAKHDPQWRDADEDRDETYDEWDKADMEVDDIILAREADED